MDYMTRFLFIIVTIFSLDFTNVHSQSSSDMAGLGLSLVDFQSGVIVVNLALIISGSNPDYATRAVNAASLAVNDINSNPAYMPLLKMNLIILYANTSTQASSAVESLLANTFGTAPTPLTCIIGDWDPSLSYTIALNVNQSYYNPSANPPPSPSSSSTPSPVPTTLRGAAVVNFNVIHLTPAPIDTLGYFPLSYRMSPADTAQVDALIDYPFYFNITNVTIIYSNDAYYGAPLLARALQKATDRGISIGSMWPITPTPDVAPMVRQMTQAINQIKLNLGPPQVDSIQNIVLPRLIIVLLPTAVFMNASFVAIPFDSALALSVSSTQLLVPSNHIALMLSAEMMASYTSASSSTPASSSSFFSSSLSSIPCTNPSTCLTATYASYLSMSIGVASSVGMFKNDASLSAFYSSSSTAAPPYSRLSSPPSSFSFSSSASSRIPLMTRYFYDSPLLLAIGLRQLLLNGSDPTVPQKLFNAIKQAAFVGASGSVLFTQQSSGNVVRQANRIAFVQMSNMFSKQGGNNVFGYWYSARGYVPLPTTYANINNYNFVNATIQSNGLQTTGGAASLLTQQPTGMPAYIPGHWQWTALPYTGTPPSARFGHCIALTTLSDQLFLYSGTFSSAQSPSLDAYTFNFATSFWSSIAIGGTFKPRTAFYNFCGFYQNSVNFTVSNGLFVFGGVNKDGVKGELWRLTSDRFSWKQLSWAVTTPGNAPAPLSNTISQDRAEGGSVQINNTLYIVGGFHRSTDQEAVLALNMSQGSSASFISSTPFYWPYSFLQNNTSWLSHVTLNSGLPSVNPVAEMAAALNLDPNPILTSAPWHNVSDNRTRTLIFIIGGGQMPANTSLIYCVEDNIVYPFFHRPGNTTSPSSGLSAPLRDISLTASANYRHPGYIYILDGWSDSANVNYNDVWLLDVRCVEDYNSSTTLANRQTCGVWTWLATKPTETRDSYRPVLYGNDIVQFGGWGATTVHNDLWTFDTESKTFTQVSPDYLAPTARELHSTTLIGNKMIVFGGRDQTQTPLNDMWSYDIDNALWTKVSPANAPPAARYGHTATAFNIALFVFGGTNTTSAFSDLWWFSVATLRWTLTSPTSSSSSPSGLVGGPAARSFHVAVPWNNELVVWGGMDTNGNVLSEMWRIDINAQVWANVFSGPYSTYNEYDVWPMNPPSTTSVNIKVANISFVCPPPHANSTGPVYDTSGNCYPSSNVTQSAAVVAGNYMYVLGGWDHAYNSVQQMCRIDISNYAYPPYNTYLATPNALPPDYALPGVTHIAYRLENPANYAWTCTLAMLPVKSRNSLTAVVSGDSIFIYGGTSYELMAPGLFVYSIMSDAWVQIVETGPQIPRPRAGSSAIIYGNKWMLFGGTMASLGTVRTATFVANEHWMYVLGAACPYSSPIVPLSLFNSAASANSSVDCTPCTPGTIAIGSSCQSCPAGFYSNAGSCAPCPQGFYSTLMGATALSFCLPCDEGTYNGVLGQSTCQTCSVDQYCPVGTITPLATAPPASSLTTYSQSQPIPLSSSSTEVSNYSLNVLYAIAALAITTVILYVLVVVYDLENVMSLFIMLDALFGWEHEAAFNKPWFRRKTAMGGGCTLFTFWFVVYFVINLALPYFLDNYVETRQLVPNVNIPDNITASMWWNVTLYSYSKSCVDTSQPAFNVSGFVNTSTPIFPCAQLISVSLNNLGLPTVGQAPFTSLGCSKYYVGNIPACTVLFYCDTCMTQTVTANVSFSFAELGSSASRIYWMVNSTAAYAGQNSSLWGYLRSEDIYLFRGLTPPTVVSTQLTPTRFSAPYASTSYSYGYTQSFISQTAGSKILPENYNSVDGLSVVFSYTNELSTMDVVRSQKLTTAQFLSQLLGSISGSLVAIALIMVMLESVEDRMLRKYGTTFESRNRGTRGLLNRLYSKLAEDLQYTLDSSTAQSYLKQVEEELRTEKSTSPYRHVPRWATKEDIKLVAKKARKRAQEEVVTPKHDRNKSTSLKERVGLFLSKRPT